MTYHAAIVHSDNQLHPCQGWRYAESTLKTVAAHPPCQSADIFVPVYQATALWRDEEPGIQYPCGNTGPGHYCAEGESRRPFHKRAVSLETVGGPNHGH